MQAMIQGLMSHYLINLLHTVCESDLEHFMLEIRRTESAHVIIVKADDKEASVELPHLKRLFSTFIGFADVVIGLIGELNNGNGCNGKTSGTAGGAQAANDAYQQGELSELVHGQTGALAKETRSEKA